MSELHYLGVRPADNPSFIPAESTNAFVADLHEAGLQAVSGVHRAPCLIPNSANLVMHPLLGTYPGDNNSYGSLSYAPLRLAMHAEILQQDGKEHTEDAPIRFSLRTAGRPQLPLGIPIHRDFDTTPQEELHVCTFLEKSVGFVALHLEIGDAHNFERRVTLTGEDASGASHSLPFTSTASRILAINCKLGLMNDIPQTGMRPF